MGWGGVTALSRKAREQFQYTQGGETVHHPQTPQRAHVPKGARSLAKNEKRGGVPPELLSEQKKKKD